jgi:hypothetical protein
MTSNARVSVQFRYEQEAEEGSLQGMQQVKFKDSLLIFSFFS